MPSCFLVIVSQRTSVKVYDPDIFNCFGHTSTSIPFSAGLGKIFRFSDHAALKTQLSGEWMLYRQFDPQEEQFTLKFEVTLLLPKLQV